jgi:hypothetical protein
MVAIGAAESGCNRTAVHVGKGERSLGPLQINVMAWRISDVCATNYYCAAKVAKQIYEKQGLNAWTAYRNGSYRQYLPRMR